jgi:hypothetical protein
MKKKKFLFLSILTLLVLPSVLAAPWNEGLLGDLVQRATYTLQEFLTYTIVIPHPYPIGSYQEEVPLWGVLAVFTLLFSVIYAASANIKIFNDEHKGPRKAFCIAVAVITMFGTPVTELLVITFAGYFTTLASLLILVGFIIGLWFILFALPGRGAGLIGRFSGESRKIGAEGKKIGAEAARVKHEADIEERDLKRSKRGFKKIWKFLNKEKKASGDLKAHLEKIRVELNLAERLKDNPAQLAEAKNRILHELATLTPILDTERRMEQRKTNILARIRQLEYRDFRLTRNEGREFKTAAQLVAEVRRRHPAARIRQQDLGAYFNRLITDERFIVQSTARINQIDAAINGLRGQIGQIVETASGEIRGNNFSAAISEINRAFELLNQQEGLINEAEQIEARVMNIVRQAFRIENFVEQEAQREGTATMGAIGHT